MKIYIASSWKNEHSVMSLAKYLRLNKGFEVDCFADKSTGRFVFHYSELPEDINQLNIKTFLLYPQSKKAFKEDKKWLDWCDCCLVLLPAGKSTHLEAGYAKGSGKKLIIYCPNYVMGEFDVMYGFADLITDDFGTLQRYLIKTKRGM